MRAQGSNKIYNGRVLMPRALCSFDEMMRSICNTHRPPARPQLNTMPTRHTLMLRTLCMNESQSLRCRHCSLTQSYNTNSLQQHSVSIYTDALRTLYEQLSILPASSPLLEPVTYDEACIACCRHSESRYHHNFATISHTNMH